MPGARGTLTAWGRNAATRGAVSRDLARIRAAELAHAELPSPSASAAQAPTGAPVLNAMEAERLVESLERHKVDEVGSPA